MISKLSSHRQTLAGIFVMLWLCFAVMSFCQWMMTQSAAAEIATVTTHDHHSMMAMGAASGSAAMPCCESQQPPCCGPTNVIPHYDSLSWLNLFAAIISVVAFLFIYVSTYSQRYRTFSPLVPPPPRLIFCRLLI